MPDGSEPAAGTLYLVGTPIGNLEDLSPRARRVLAGVDRIACEDTRHSGLLLQRLGVRARCLSYHEHNQRQRIPELLEALGRGESLALISDAGLPGISDPGEPLVAAARAAGDLRAWALRGYHRPGEQRPAQRPLLLRGLPAGEGGPAAAKAGGAGR